MDRANLLPEHDRFMNGICGWLATAPAAAAAPQALEIMAGAIATQTARTLLASASATGGAVPCDVRGEGHRVIAIQGVPTFTEPDLAEIARERGAAAAASLAYERHGDECLAHIRGPFALAVLDGDRRRALLAIDRMGIRSLCFAFDDDGVVFGSRVSHVVAHPSFSAAIAPQGVFNYLYCHVVPSPGTIFEGVSKLQPGERIVFENGRVRREFYWQLAYVDRAEVPIATLEQRFRTIVRASVARAADDEAVGAFLSGGTDSSTVTGYLTELLGSPADTYSIGFRADGFDEMEFARITARHFGSRPHEYYVTPDDVLEAVPKIASAADEPFGNESVVAAYCCARMAQADGKRLLLAGDGGDEIFGGNARYARQKVFEAYALVPGMLRRYMVEPVLFALPDRFAAIRKARSYVRQARTPLPDRLEDYNFLERERLAEILEPDFLAAIDTKMPATLARDAYFRVVSRSAVNRMMHLDLKQTLADNDLRKVGLACELAGVNVAFPLLDEELVEFSGLVPPNQKVKGVQLRYLFKHALKDFLPAETLAKSKHGFGLPFGLWLRNDQRLRALVNDSFASLRRRGFVRPAYLDYLSDMHDNDHASYYGVMIWVLLMLEQWLRQHAD